MASAAAASTGAATRATASEAQVRLRSGSGSGANVTAQALPSPRRLRRPMAAARALTRDDGFDHREAIDDVFDGAMDGVKRILRTPFALPDRGDVALDGLFVAAVGGMFGAGRLAIAAHLFKMDKQIGDSPFNRFEMGEAGVRSVEAA